MKCSHCGTENPAEATFCNRCAAPFGAEAGSPTLTGTMRQPVCELATGTTFVRRYQVIEELGRGGMGRVYKVFDTEVKEKLALKLLRPDIAADAETVERFRSELRLARTVSHRNVCRMHDLGRDEETGTYFITMEYVPGDDLKSLIHSIGALPVAKAVTIARQVVEGLAEAHCQGIVHRDLKPQNIMIDRDGGARIMDFGIARSVKARSITGTGVMIGTPEYMSPEQVEGKEADARADIYALGIVLFEMLTGRLPFSGETALSVAVKQKSEAPPDPRAINAQIPDDLARCVLKCLEKSKEKRFSGAEELLKELVRIEKTLPATSTPLRARRPPTSKEFTVHLPSKKFWIPAVAVLLAVVALIIWQFVPEAESARRAVAVLGFQNQTGDQSLDSLRETIPNLLITSLEQSKFLRVASWQRLKDLLRQEGKDPQAVFDEEAGFAACRKAGIELAVVGLFSKAGETFVSDVKVLDVGTREVVKSVSARGNGVDSILKSQIDEISRGVSRGISRPVLKVERPVAKVADLTTNSMEAYHYFLRGRDEVENLVAADGKKFLEKAVALDPTFAVAYLYLAHADYLLVDYKSQQENLKKAMAYSGKASEKERLTIESRYALTVDDDTEKSRSLLEEMIKKYPGEKYPFFELGKLYYAESNMSAAIQTFEKAVALDPKFGPAFNMIGYSHARNGDFMKAEAAFQRYIEANPGDPNPLDSLAELYLRFGQLDKAEAKYKEVLEIKPDFTSSCKALAYLRALKEDYPGIFHWLDEFMARAMPTQKMEGLALICFYDFFSGRLERALAEALNLRKIGESYGQEFVMASADRIAAILYAEMGRFDEARNGFASYEKYIERTTPGRQALHALVKAYDLAWLAFKQGQGKDARAQVENMKERLPALRKDEDAKYYPLRCRLLDAEISLAESSAEAALAATEKMDWMDFPGVNTPELFEYNTPWEKDVIARALWKKGDLSAAAAEYRRLMTIDPHNQIRYLVHPLYHYRLGRVLEEKGDKTGAAGEYRKFLEFWKDADASRPEPADARKRLAVLAPASR